jgi:hypothetical protein
MPMSNSDTAVSAQLFDARSKEFSKIEKVEAPAGKLPKACGELAKRLVGSLTRGGLVVAELTAPELPFESKNVPMVEQPASRSKTGRITKQWWFWPTTIAVVLGAGVATYLLMNRKTPNYNVLDVPNPLTPP